MHMDKPAKFPNKLRIKYNCEMDIRHRSVKIVQNNDKIINTRIMPVLIYIAIIS